MTLRYTCVLLAFTLLAVPLSSLQAAGSDPGPRQANPEGWPTICEDIPDAVILTPDGSIPFSFTLGLGQNCRPIVGSIIEVEFSPEADALIAWAPGQEHPIATGVTDEVGHVTFHFAGAGCVDPDRFTGPTYIVQVRADDIVLAEPYVTSPDVVSASGLLPTELGTSICEDGVSTVGLSDAVFHTRSIKDARVEPCSKLTGNPDDPVNLDDAVALTPFIKAGGFIACDPAAAPGWRR